eukprot:6121577-Pleurochrysis_carterae.AAC.3
MILNSTGQNSAFMHHGILQLAPSASHMVTVWTTVIEIEAQFTALENDIQSQSPCHLPEARPRRRATKDQGLRTATVQPISAIRLDDMYKTGKRLSLRDWQVNNTAIDGGRGGRNRPFQYETRSKKLVRLEHDSSIAAHRMRQSTDTAVGVDLLEHFELSDSIGKVCRAHLVDVDAERCRHHLGRRAGTAAHCTSRRQRRHHRRKVAEDKGALRRELRAQRLLDAQLFGQDSKVNG